MYEALSRFDYPVKAAIPEKSRELIADAMQMGRTSPRSVSAWLALDDEIDILASEAEINAAIRWCTRVGEVIEKIGESKYELFFTTKRKSSVSSIFTVDQILTEILDMPAWKSLLFVAAWDNDMDSAIDWLTNQFDDEMVERGWKYEAADD